MNVCLYSLYCFIIGISQITETKFHKNITNILTLIDILVSLIYFNFNVNLTASNWPQVDGSLQTILGYGRVTAIASGRVEPSLEVRVVPLPLALP